MKQYKQYNDEHVDPNDLSPSSEQITIPTIATVSLSNCESSSTKCSTDYHPSNGTLSETSKDQSLENNVDSASLESRTCGNDVNLNSLESRTFANDLNSLESRTSETDFNSNSLGSRTGESDCNSNSFESRTCEHNHNSIDQSSIESKSEFSIKKLIKDKALLKGIIDVNAYKLTKQQADILSSLRKNKGRNHFIRSSLFSNKELSYLIYAYDLIDQSKDHIQCLIVAPTSE